MRVRVQPESEIDLVKSELSPIQSNPIWHHIDILHMYHSITKRIKNINKYEEPFKSPFTSNLKLILYLCHKINATISILFYFRWSQAVIIFSRRTRLEDRRKYGRNFVAKSEIFSNLIEMFSSYSSSFGRKTHTMSCSN